MSSDKEMKIVKSSAGQGLVPRLRFPEFLEAGEWEVDTFAEIIEVVDGDRGTNYPKAHEFSNTGYCLFLNAKNVTKNGFKFEDLQFITKEKDSILRKGKLQRNDIVLTTRGTIGQFAYFSDDISYNNMRINSGMVILRIKVKKINADYLYTFSKSRILRVHIKNTAFGNAQQQLTVAEIKKFRLYYPKLEEQQKIANCLSSLDDLISAETQQLATLKAHKKALMQQLFPAEGETVPQLHFPEFFGAGEWEEKILKNITSSIFDGTHQTPTYTQEGIPFYSVENLVSGNKNKFISREDYIVSTSKNKPAKGDILLTRIGKIGYSQVVTWEHEFSIYVTLAVIKQSELFDSYYLHYFFQSARYQSEIFKNSLLNAVPCKINMNSLRNTHILLAQYKEQQKIAACLSSLDDLITAQTQKINTLKQHKKGLMQQLFPQVET